MELEILEMAWVECKKFRLTDREVEIAELTARGYANRTIARQLTITPQTVKSHINSVTHKIGIQRTDGMVRRVLIVERLRQMGLGRKQT